MKTLSPRESKWRVWKPQNYSGAETGPKFGNLSPHLIFFSFSQTVYLKSKSWFQNQPWFLPSIPRLTTPWLSASLPVPFWFLGPWKLVDPNILLYSRSNSKCSNKPILFFFFLINIPLSSGFHLSNVPDLQWGYLVMGTEIPEESPWVARVQVTCSSPFRSLRWVYQTTQENRP